MYRMVMLIIIVVIMMGRLAPWRCVWSSCWGGFRKEREKYSSLLTLILPSFGKHHLTSSVLHLLNWLAFYTAGEGHWGQAPRILSPCPSSSGSASKKTFNKESVSQTVCLPHAAGSHVHVRSSHRFQGGGFRERELEGSFLMEWRSLDFMACEINSGLGIVLDHWVTGIVVVRAVIWCLEMDAENCDFLQRCVSGFFQSDFQQRNPYSCCCSLSLISLEIL